MSAGKTIGLSLVGVIVLVVVLIAGGLFYLWSSLDSIVEAAIEEYGSQVTQTKVDVGGVKVKQALTSGEGSISGIDVGNPKGFTYDSIFTLGNITVGVDTNTVTDKVVVIKKIIVDAPQVFYEINDDGVANLDVLQKNIEEATAELKKQAGVEDSGGGSSEEIKLIIDKLVINEAEVDARIAALGGKNLSTNIPRIELNNIGRDSGGTTPAAVAEKVAKVLITKIYPEIAKLGVQQYLGIDAEAAKAQLEEKAAEAKKQIEDKAKEALGGAGGDAVTDQVGDKLKGLFGN